MSLLSYLQKLAPLTDEGREQLFLHIDHHVFATKEPITFRQRNNHRLWWVETGIVGQFALWNGQLQCRAFLQAGSGVYTLPEGQWLQALTACALESVPYFLLQDLERHQRLLIEAQWRQTEQFIQFQRLRPVDRYRHLLTYQSEIIQRVSNTVIAGFIGISLESLSRLKARM